MSSLTEAWKEYRKVYPEQLHPSQERELHQTFMSGAFSAVVIMDKIATLPEDQAVKTLQKFTQETMSHISTIAKHRITHQGN